nr:flagellar filament capping protein FliD [Lachnospiraceae bacterium]
MASPTRVSGMVSGIDTESVVQAYVQSYVDKKTKVQQSQTKLSYKQDAWKELNTKVYSLYSKMGSLKFSTSYNLKKTTISDSTKASVSASSSAVIGTQTLEISKLAKSGYLTGAQLAKGTTETTTLSDLGYGDGDTTISVRVGSGEEKEISLSGDSTISDVITALKGAGVNASYDANNRRIFVNAKDSGASNDFAITASSTSGTNALSSLGLLTSGAADIAGYAANAAYALNSDGEKYYVLDDDGNVTYDDEGNAVTNGTYDRKKTLDSITNILTNLANAYDENTSLAAENSELSEANATLQKQIDFSESKDAVTAAKSSYSELMSLLEAKTDGKAYVGSDGNTYESEDDVPEGVEATAIDDAIKAKATELGLITSSEDDEGNTVEDTTAYDEIVAAYDKYVGYGGDDSEITYLDSEARATAETTIENNNNTITTNTATIATNNEYISENSYWDAGDYSEYYNESGNLDISELASSIVGKIEYANEVLKNGIPANAGATRVTGQDAVITLNGAEYTSSTSNFSINGLNINALAETSGEITISTTQDSQGIYDKVKDFLSTYNEIINEMQSLYNADSAKGYEPLTDEQKEEMSESEIEKWETKIKDSILRRDSSLGTLINKMTSAMSTPITMNGRGYSLSDFGIQTLGYMNAAKNEQYAYH